MKIVIIGIGSAAIMIADIIASEHNYEVVGFDVGFFRDNLLCDSFDDYEKITCDIRNVTKYTLTSYTQSREVNDYTTKIKYSLECYLKELGNYLEDFYTYNSSWTTMEADATLLLFKLGVM